MKILMQTKVLIFAAMFCVSLLSSALAEKTLILSSLDWPPYTGKNLQGNGDTSKIVREAFASMGYTVEFHFLPWKRVVRSVQTDSRVVGYFPEYYLESQAEKYIYSDSIGCSPLGVLTKKNNPIAWSRVEDLSEYKIGVVSGYINTEPFDNLIRGGTMHADYAPSDESNIKKLIRGRIQGAVIDRNVYNYISTTHPDLKKQREELIFSSKLLGTNKLYICFRRNSEGAKYADIFNEGLKKIGIVSSKESCR